MTTKSKPSSCLFDCIFHEGRLHGDCRIPWSDDCALNIQRKHKNAERFDWAEYDDNSEDNESDGGY